MKKTINFDLKFFNFIVKTFQRRGLSLEEADDYSLRLMGAYSIISQIYDVYQKEKEA